MQRKYAEWKAQGFPERENARGPLDERQEAIIAEGLAQGLTPAEIARRACCSYYAVSKRARRGSSPADAELLSMFGGEAA